MKKLKRWIFVVGGFGVMLVLLLFGFFGRTNPPRWWIVQAMEVRMISDAVQYYEMEYGVPPPVVDNARLIQVLLGDNPRKIEFINLDPGQDERNPKGEMVDAWGTPFQFWIDGQGKFCFRSAGPDTIFGTKDDRAWSFDSKEGLKFLQGPGGPHSF